MWRAPDKILSVSFLQRKNEWNGNGPLNSSLSLSCVSAAKSLTGTSAVFRLFLLMAIQSVLSNMYEMEHFLKGVHNIDWTVVRPPGLRNEPATSGFLHNYELLSAKPSANVNHFHIKSWL